MNLRRSIQKQKGFTLIELLVAAAIISLLVAIAIPQYVRFTWRTKRLEAYLALENGKKAQLAYYSSNDHFLRNCGNPSSNCATPPLETMVTNLALGLNDNSLTNMGYRYSWQYHVGDAGYALYLSKDLNPNNSIDDTLFISVNLPLFTTNYGPCGLQDGVPFIINDDIKSEVSPCS